MSVAVLFRSRESRVITFTVHEPPNHSSDRIDRAEALEFVRDGFTYSAAALAPVWLIAKQQWLAFVIYLVAITTMLLGLAAIDARPEAFLLVSSALNLLVGFEADTIQRWTLARSGYTMLGTVSGRTQLECERNFLDDWLPQQPVISGSSTGGTAGTLAGAAFDFSRSPGAPGRGWLDFLKRA